MSIEPLFNYEKNAKVYWKNWLRNWHQNYEEECKMHTQDSHRVEHTTGFVAYGFDLLVFILDVGCPPLFTERTTTKSIKTQHYSPLLTAHSFPVVLSNTVKALLFFPLFATSTVLDSNVRVFPNAWTNSQHVTQSNTLLLTAYVGCSDTSENQSVNRFIQGMGTVPGEESILVTDQ